MTTYRVARDCYGFKGGYWKEGQIVELEDDEKPPYHFQKVDEKGRVIESEKKDRSADTYSGIQKAEEEEAPNTGFAHRPKSHTKSHHK